MTPRSRALFIGLVIPLVVIFDQWSKYLVLNEPQFNALSCLDGTQYCGQIEVSALFDLTMLWNRGMSFGTLQSEGLMRWVLFGVQAVIAGFFFHWLLRSADRKLTGAALSIVVGGAIGNMIDRARFGAVVDFLDFSALWFPWIFNIADAAITVGAGLLFLDFFLTSRKQSGTGDDAPAGLD